MLVHVIIEDFVGHFYVAHITTFQTREAYPHPTKQAEDTFMFDVRIIFLYNLVGHMKKKFDHSLTYVALMINVSVS
jgi:hypothetical protein